MTNKFRNKYRISSVRLQTWDYGNNGAYFITICTLNRDHFFGEIVNAEMRLSEIGKIAEQQWIRTPDLRPDMNLKMDVFVVMPNHVHGIIIIGENQYNTYRKMNCEFPMNLIKGGSAMHCRSTFPGTPNHFGPQSKNLASIIRGFKSSVTTQAKKSGNNMFAWQSLYYEHIIRNQTEFCRIRKYIINNPVN